MKVATLVPTMIERWMPSKKCYAWVKAYIVINPDGVELAPPMRAITSHYEAGAREFCRKQGWRVIIKK